MSIPECPYHQKKQETKAASFGITIRNYNADNGRFQDNACKKDCESKAQGLTYCGVNAHWQNGKAEKRIRDIQDFVRVILTHAIKR